MEVKCTGIENGHAEAERIPADPGDRRLEENLERETESFLLTTSKTTYTSITEYRRNSAMTSKCKFMENKQ